MHHLHHLVFALKILIQAMVDKEQSYCCQSHEQCNQSNSLPHASLRAVSESILLLFWSAKAMAMLISNQASFKTQPVRWRCDEDGSTVGLQAQSIWCEYFNAGQLSLPCSVETVDHIASCTHTLTEVLFTEFKKEKEKKSLRR